MNHQFEIIMPLAGRGQRFKDQNVELAKPLILAHNTPLFYVSLLSLQPILTKSRITFIVCEEDKIAEPISTFVKGKLANFQIVSLKKRTKGPAETLLNAKTHIDLQRPLISLDCDLYFECERYFQHLLNTSQNSSGAFCYFHSTEPRYSYIQTNDDNVVIDIAEKSVISDKALIGSYYFKNAFTLMKALENLSPPTGEPFISHAIKELLNQDQSFEAYPSTEYHSYGTPEELKKSLQFKPKFST